MRNNAESLMLKGFKLNFSIEVEEITIHSSDEQNDSLDYMELMDKVASVTKDVADYFAKKQNEKQPTVNHECELPDDFKAWEAEPYKWKRVRSYFLFVSAIIFQGTDTDEEIWDRIKHFLVASEIISETMSLKNGYCWQILLDYLNRSGFDVINEIPEEELEKMRAWFIKIERKANETEETNQHPLNNTTNTEKQQ